jgi:hypothetical protein
MTPIRVRLSRQKGWKMPANTVNVARPTCFGNPFRIGRDGDAATCVRKFESAIKAGILKNFPLWDRPNVGWKLALRGKNLACWCAPNQPCHADVLLRLANPDPSNSTLLTSDPATAVVPAAAT